MLTTLYRATTLPHTICLFPIRPLFVSFSLLHSSSLLHLDDRMNRMNRMRTTSNTARQNAATPSSTERRAEQSVASEFDVAVSAASSQGAGGSVAVLDRRAMQEEADLLFALELSRTIDIDDGRRGHDADGDSGGDAGGGLGGGGRMGRAFSDGDVSSSVQRMLSRDLSITDEETTRAVLSIESTRAGGNQPPSQPSVQPRRRTYRSHTMYSDSGAMTSASRGRGATRFVKRL